MFQQKNIASYWAYLKLAKLNPYGVMCDCSDVGRCEMARQRPQVTNDQSSMDVTVVRM